MQTRFHPAVAAALLTSLLLVVSAGRALAQPDNLAREERQRKLIQVLQSDAPAAEKAITCKQLVTCATKDAVPALAALLPNPELTSWARIALEAIPDPAADQALREALGKTQGRVLIGVINSIGYRRDAQAVDALVSRLKDADAEVAAAAAVALGKIGGEPSAQALAPVLAAASPVLRAAAADGCIRCAERFLADGKHDQAIKLYDAVRQANVPAPRLAEATRGAILARQSAGIPLLLEQLRSSDKGTLNVALRTARELPGGEVTDALLAEFAKAAPQRQPLLLLALADRGDAKVLSVALEAAKSGAPAVRVVAATVLEQLGNASCVPVLVDCAAADSAELSQAAMATLARMPGKEVDAALLARVQQSSGKMRQLLIPLVEQRRIEGAMAVFMGCAEDADAGVRTAALEAVGAIGEPKQVPELLKLFQKTQAAADRAVIEKALMAISGRWTAACRGQLLPLMQSTDGATRITGLHVLACCGGPEALAAVKAAIDDKDESVQDEAVRTLSTWPNRWPQDASAAEPLLALAKSGKKPAHQILALRGYFQFVQGAKGLSADQRLARVKDAMPLLARPEEKRLAIAALGAIGTAGALDPLKGFAADPATTEEACAAIIGLVTRSRGLPREPRQAALQTVVEKSKSDATRKKAQDLLQASR